jgi:hypothetical protein
MTDDKAIDAYISRLGDWRGPAIRELADLVERVAPETRGSIKWAQPVYEVNGPCIWIKAYPRSVSIGFWRGAAIEDAHGLLLGEGDRMRHVTVRAGEAVDEAAVTDYIRQAIALNQAKGDPTRRQPKEA